ncbi:MAG: hypothetical protein CSB16_02655 [Clostridiales bacterium]|nr:MAG: hypothetical protein CSB16_02655 [Clostridiales bacterium]
MEEQLSETQSILNRTKSDLNVENDKLEKTNKKLKTATNKLVKSKEIYEAIQYSLNNYMNFNPDDKDMRLLPSQKEELDLFAPTVSLHLNHMNIKDLRKAFRKNDKDISSVLENYSARYNTKANKAIYSLMVVSLRSELQNILSTLKYEQLDTAIAKVKEMSDKYLKIAAEGNKSISGTLTKFIGEVEYLFINAVKIEYNYHVKKEKERQEKLEAREQLKQEKKEREALRKEQQRVEAEEKKYQEQLSKLQEQSLNATDEEKSALNSRIKELEAQLNSVVLKKEEIANLQHGKAGTVYIISNLGAFGEKVFKVGMTRRLEPMDRVNELGSASIPFKYDVHSFIFSNDAVALEKKLHDKLNENRLNKVNMRKEFFVSSIDEMEQLVNDIEPTAEFNREMTAEDYKQSISSDTNYTILYKIFDAFYGGTEKKIREEKAKEENKEKPFVPKLEQFHFNVAGVTFYKGLETILKERKGEKYEGLKGAALKKEIQEYGDVQEYEISGKKDITFVHEPENEHDSNAIAIIHDEYGKIGYVPKDKQEELNKIINIGNLIIHWFVVGGKYKTLDYEDKIETYTSEYGLEITVVYPNPEYVEENE